MDNFKKLAEMLKKRNKQLKAKFEKNSGKIDPFIYDPSALYTWW